MQQPTRLPLPDLGRGDLLVDITANFHEVEGPLDNCWNLRYETSSWYSWQDLQPYALYSQELSTLRKRGSPGVYEIVRAWEEPGNPNPYLYVGRSGSESLGELLRLLVRPPAKESHAHGPGKSKPHEQRSAREKMIARAKEVLEVEDDAQVLPWLYIRWSVCDSPLELALIEYYLQFLRNPLFAERKVPNTWSQESHEGWWAR